MDDATNQFRNKIKGMSLPELSALSEIIKQRSRDCIEEMYAVAEEVASNHARGFAERSQKLLALAGMRFHGEATDEL